MGATSKAKGLPALPGRSQPSGSDCVRALEILGKSGNDAGEDSIASAIAAIQTAFGTRWAGFSTMPGERSSNQWVQFYDGDKASLVGLDSFGESLLDLVFGGDGEDRLTYADGVRETFPDSRLLEDFSARGLVVRRVPERDGKSGMFCWVMSADVIECSDIQLALFDVAVARVVERLRQAAGERLFLSVDDSGIFAGAANDWMWETDVSDRFTWLGSRSVLSLGVPVTELIGQRRKDLVDQAEIENEAEKWGRYDEIIVAREPLRDFRYSSVLRSGERRIFRINGLPYYGTDGTFLGYRGTASDATDFDGLQYRLAESRARKDFIISGSGSALWDWDLETGQIWFAGAWKELLQLDDDGLAQLDILERMHAEDVEAHREKLIAHFKGTTSHFQSTTRLCADDGTWRWIEFRGQAVMDETTGRAKRFVGQALDVSRLKETEAALVASERRYAMSYQATRDGVWEWDIESDVCIGTPRLFELLGMASDDGKISVNDLIQVILPEDLQAHRASLQQCISGATDTYRCEFRVRRGDGQIRHIQNRGVAIRNKDGVAMSMIGSISDVTELLEAEQELRAALDRAEYANRAKIEFLANMSHELRTPLNSIIGFSETIRDRMFGDNGARYSEYAGHVCESARHLLELINDILDVSRIEAGEMPIIESVFSPVTAMNAAARLMSRRITDRQLTFSLEAEGSFPNIRADERRLKQIFVNLIGNAVKFTDPGGVISFSCEYDPGNGLTFMVTDSGIGIPEDQFDQVMKVFGQVDGSFTRNYDGVGLGLPLSRNLAELHGGSLELRSRTGVGTTAIVKLPQWRCLTDDTE